MSSIGVILPVYNGENFIGQSVESILKQTFTDFTLYVIEDGSKDKTINTLNNFNDKRLKVIQNDGNKGLIYSLNRGLELSRECKYIARMDADDISFPNRLAVQYDFMERNTHIGLLGTAMEQFGDKRKHKRNIFRPQTSDKIASSFLFYNPFSHPTMMIRSEKLLYDFSYDFPKYEDYHLWIRHFRNIGVYNLNDILLKYRRHHNNVTSTYKNEVLKDHDFIQKLITLFAQQADIILSDEEINAISIISSSVRYNLNTDFALNELYHIQNAVKLKLNKYFDGDYFEYLFQERMFLYFLKLKRYKELAIVFSKMKNKRKFIDAVLYKPKS